MPDVAGDTPPSLTLVPARHRAALLALDPVRWKGVRDGGLTGNTQDALARLGVAETTWVKKPYRHQRARLTALGVAYLEAHREAVLARASAPDPRAGEHPRRKGIGS